MPEDLVRAEVHLAVPVGLVDGALVHRVGRAVGAGVVDEGVVRQPDQIVRFPAEHPGRGPVGKGHPAVEVEPEDALAGGLEDQFQAPLELAHLGFRLDALGDLPVERGVGHGDLEGAPVHPLLEFVAVVFALLSDRGEFLLQLGVPAAKRAQAVGNEHGDDTEQADQEQQGQEGKGPLGERLRAGEHLPVHEREQHRDNDEKYAQLADQACFFRHDWSALPPLPADR